jgi:hypothetical protein
MLLRRDLGSLLARLPWLGRPTTQRMCYPSASFRKGCMRRREFIAGAGRRDKERGVQAIAVGEAG